jgi:hypothetical protein
MGGGVEKVGEVRTLIARYMGAAKANPESCIRAE